MLDLKTMLKQQFAADRAADFDLGVELDCADQRHRIDIRNGTATFYKSAEQAPTAELVLYFRDEQKAKEILSGHLNPLDAFMQGELRSNGYLFWVFRTLAIFAAIQADS